MADDDYYPDDYYPEDYFPEDYNPEVEENLGQRQDTDILIGHMAKRGYAGHL